MVFAAAISNGVPPKPAASQHDARACGRSARRLRPLVQETGGQPMRRGAAPQLRVDLHPSDAIALDWTTCELRPIGC